MVSDGLNETGYVVADGLILQLTMIIGIIIFFIGLGISSYAQWYSKKTPYGSNTLQMGLQELPCRQVVVFAYPSAQKLRIKTSFDKKIKNKFFYKINRTSLARTQFRGDNFIPQYDPHNSKINGKNGKYCEISLESEYRYEIEIEFENVNRDDNQVLLEPEYRLDLEGNPDFANIEYEIFKSEKPYAWLFPLGLTLITLSAVIGFSK